MADILLLEPNYKNKYPPLGLMKLSSYHKQKGDYVWFSKGKLPESFKYKKWDRVYLTTLFTFEWNETKKTIEYAKALVKSQKDIYVGGIAATLMPDKIRAETGVNVIEGLLNKPGKIGYDDDHIIDTLTPDYEILDNVGPNMYSPDDAYFMYTTRGCGMKCGFCAVQTLEPEYINFYPIVDQIKEIDEKFGQKRYLLLMDNNVLKSSRFDDIIEEIKEAGFYKGATYKSPKSGIWVNRYIDFNQGLDAYLLDDHKAKRLSEIAIRPARIAFDHIEDKNIYIQAVELCAKYDILELSNYILYNSDSFSGKGHSYMADTPEHFYERLRITTELREKINADRPKDKKISIFSFPMRYIPLQDSKRGYVGEKWNTKSLRAVQTMLIPTQGKGVSSKAFFEADFGKNIEEFLETLYMPEDLISLRGRFVDKKDETDEQKAERRIRWEENNILLNQWRKLYRSLGEKKYNFIELIKENVFNATIFKKIEDSSFAKLYLFYFNESKLLTMLSQLKDKKKFSLIYDFCVNSFPILIKRISEYVGKSNISTNKLQAFINVFGETGIKLVLQQWIKNGYSNDTLITSFDKCMMNSGDTLVSGFLLKTFKSYVDFDALSQNNIDICNQYITELNNNGLKDILIKNCNKFRKAMLTAIVYDAGNNELKNQVEQLSEEIHQQLSLI